MKSKLKAKREEMGFTQAELAIKAQISIRGYQNIETGNRVPNVLSAKRIASVLKTTVEEIFPVFPEDAESAKLERMNSTV